VEVDESITDVEVISPTGNHVTDANLEDTGLLTFPATRVGRYIVKSSRGPVAEVEALDAAAVKVLSIGDSVAHRPAILTGIVFFFINAMLSRWYLSLIAGRLIF
jgi:hypothetical protein